MNADSYHNATPLSIDIDSSFDDTPTPIDHPASSFIGLRLRFAHDGGPRKGIRYVARNERRYHLEKQKCSREERQ